MFMPLLFAAACFGLLSTGAVAQQSSKWEEPTSFLGVKLDEPVSIPRCARGSDELCQVPSLTGNKDLTIIRRTPDLGFSYSLYAFTNDGVTYDVSLDTKATNFLQLKTLLVERYGPPHKDEQQTVHNGFGTAFPDEVLTWEGPNMQITLEQRSGSIDKSSVDFRDKAGYAAVNAKIGAEIRSKASAL